MENYGKTYDDFWSTELARGQKFKNRSWFKRPGWRWLSRFWPRLALKRGSARRYQRGIAAIIEGFFCDLGCGLGGCVGLHQAFSKDPAVGIDVSATAIKFAYSEKKRLKFNLINFLAGDTFYTPFKNDLFGTVYLGQVLEHVPDEKKALREAVRILNPGGKLIISVPKEDCLPSPYHLRTYTTQSLTELLTPYTNQPIAFHEFDPKRLVVSLSINKNS
ncbi:MAG: class I SAM-dependent methyltransferase [Planctomycetes bacterium]|nr:class I SAM-dependent methyltransferase [Planctomycetota bacterium]